jgi:hypothetical protein
MKKGIVLLMTLGFITVIAALILWSVSITKNRFDTVMNLQNRNQFDLVFADFTKMVKKFDINSSQKLDLFLQICFPPLIEPKSGLGVGFCSESLMDRLNMNYMLESIVQSDHNSSKKEAASFYMRAFEKFFSKYEMSDPYTFINMLLDTLDLDDIERSSYSEIASENYDFRQGRIYSFSQFKKIEDNYYRVTKDSSIYKIDKDELSHYFYLGDPKSPPLLDCSGKNAINSFSLIVTDEMSLSNDLDVDLCAESNTTAMRKLKKIYNISQYSNKSKYLVRCNIDLESKESRQTLTFDFEVNSKRISNIEKSF